jgi:hypothetical protein
MNSLKNIHHDQYKVDAIQYSKYLIKDCTAKKKEFTQDKSKEKAINIKNIGYIGLYYNGNPLIYVTTPIMTCLFGMDKNTKTMSLQFKDVNTDPSMKGFFNFIKGVEINNMINLGITDEQDYDKYGSQIKYDKNGKYDPNLLVKVPFDKNRYEVDVFNDEEENINIYYINNFTRMKCDIYIDKIWKYNEVFYCKWKARKIYLV